MSSVESKVEGVKMSLKVQKRQRTVSLAGFSQSEEISLDLCCFYGGWY